MVVILIMELRLQVCRVGRVLDPRYQLEVRLEIIPVDTPEQTCQQERLRKDANQNNCSTNSSGRQFETLQYKLQNVVFFISPVKHNAQNYISRYQAHPGRFRQGSV